MKRWGRLLFVFIAYSFALLHTAVPHHHAAPRAGETTISHAQCTSAGEGLLQRALSTDLGYGHLENFKKSSSTEVDFSIDASSPLLLTLQSLLDAPLVSFGAFGDGYVVKLHNRLLLFASTQFRAPPPLF